MIVRWYRCIKVCLANPFRAQLEWTIKVMFLGRSGKNYTTWKKNIKNSSSKHWREGVECFGKSKGKPDKQIEAEQIALDLLEKIRIK